MIYKESLHDDFGLHLYCIIRFFLDGLCFWLLKGLRFSGCILLITLKF